MCPPVVGISYSQNMGRKRTTSPPGGHTGPPLRQAARLGRNYPTYFVIFVPISGEKKLQPTAAPKNLATHHVGTPS